MKPLLEVKEIEAGYGAIRVLRGVSIEVYKGEIVALIGANGAGKTTIMRVVSGLLPPSKGEVHFQGQRIDRMPPHKIVRRGLFLIQEGRCILQKMSVRENLLMGAFSRAASEIDESMGRVFRMFPLLEERQNQLGGTLSGGQQQMLAIGRALMARPTLYMMDEPSLGLAPLLVNEVFATIGELKGSDVGILLVEQNARKALQIADRAYCLETGQIVLSGKGEELQSDARVSEVYLGGHRAKTSGDAREGVGK